MNKDRMHINFKKCNTAVNYCRLAMIQVIKWTGWLGGGPCTRWNTVHQVELRAPGGALDALFAGISTIL